MEALGGWQPGLRASRGPRPSPGVRSAGLLARLKPEVAIRPWRGSCQGQRYCGQRQGPGGGGGGGAVFSAICVKKMGLRREKCPLTSPLAQDPRAGRQQLPN